MKLWSITGNSQLLDGGAMFGNVPKAMWEKWLPPDELNRVPLACRALLAKPLNGKTVLFETGIGAFFNPAMRQRFGVVESKHVLLDSLSEAGVTHEEIDVVVLSHLHFDHAGGLLGAWQDGQAPQLLFPKARYLVGASHWQRAINPHPRDRASFIPELTTLLQSSGRLELVNGEHSETLGDSVRFHFSEGHTPGLMLAELVGPDNHGGLLFCADLIPGRSWVHLPITMGYDRYPECLIDEKAALLDDAVTRGVRLFFTHDHEVALARVTRDERRRYVTDHFVEALTARSLTQ